MVNGDGGAPGAFVLVLLLLLCRYTAEIRELQGRKRVVENYWAVH